MHVADVRYLPKLIENKIKKKEPCLCANINIILTECILTNTEHAPFVLCEKIKWGMNMEKSKIICMGDFDKCIFMLLKTIEYNFFFFFF